MAMYRVTGRKGIWHRGKLYKTGDNIELSASLAEANKDRVTAVSVLQAQAAVAAEAAPVEATKPAAAAATTPAFTMAQDGDKFDVVAEDGTKQNAEPLPYDAALDLLNKLKNGE